MIAHDPGCTLCAGRGHVWTPPEALGWLREPKPRQWFVPKGGGFYTFSPGQPEAVMTLCECVRTVAR